MARSHSDGRRRGASRSQMRIGVVGAASIAILTACAGTARQAEPAPTRLEGRANFLTSHPARNADGTANAVVEIPGGTTAKWETAKDGNAIEWEMKDGARRVVRYLGYPGSYGIIPGTLLSAAEGGDGDPLDVIVIGDAIARGETLRIRLVAVLYLLDDGEVDDKLVAVAMEGALAGVTDLGSLRAELPGSAEILETWFTNYKGPGRIRSKGFGDAAAANAVLDRAAASFARGRSGR